MGALAYLAQGIIPADAGSTIPAKPGFYKDGDHPRGCGEHLIEYSLSLFGQGSSPRMRGARSYLSS